MPCPKTMEGEELVVSDDPDDPGVVEELVVFGLVGGGLSAIAKQR